MLGFTHNLVNPENYRTVFFGTKQKTDEMLSAHNNVDFLINPAVDVNTIAIKNGIIEIKLVPKQEIPEKHATLKDGVIKLSNEDSSTEQRFSTGHELEHHIKGKADEEKKENERKLRKISFMGRPNRPDKQSEKQVKSVFEEAARSDYDWLIQELKTISFFLSKLQNP